MFRDILGWADEGKKHGIPWCCGVRFGIDWERPKVGWFLPRRLLRPWVRLISLFPDPRGNFAVQDQQGYVPCEYHLLKWLVTGWRPDIMQDEETYIEQVAAKARRVCEEKGWKRNWSNGGCYLHLEASEFIEALRGKGDEPPENEAADVLFVLLSMLHYEDISAQKVLEILDKKCDDLLAHDHDKDRACT